MSSAIARRCTSIAFMSSTRRARGVAAQPGAAARAAANRTVGVFVRAVGHPFKGFERGRIDDLDAALARRRHPFAVDELLVKIPGHGVFSKMSPNIASAVRGKPRRALSEKMRKCPTALLAYGAVSLSVEPCKPYAAAPICHNATTLIKNPSRCDEPSLTHCVVLRPLKTMTYPEANTPKKPTMKPSPLS